MSVYVSGVKSIERRLYHRRWSRTFMEEQSKTAGVIRKLLKNNPYSGLFGSHSEKIDKMLQTCEKSY